MKSNRRKDTSPELRLRSKLHARGWRFRVDARVDAGDAHPRPDVVFPRYRVAVFVDGCFWHRCPIHSRAPKLNAAYWKPKLARNVARDRADTVALESSGWRVVRIWEHVPVDDAVRIVERCLTEANGTG